MKLKTILLTVGLSVLFSMQAMAGWVQTDNGQWSYEQNGAKLTSQWYDDNGTWYYLDDNGIMLAGITQNINGVDYTFDASGRWLDPASAGTGVYDGIYKNMEMKYSFQLPAGIAYEVDEDGDLFLDTDSLVITTTTFTGLHSNEYAKELADFFTTELISNVNYLVTLDYQTQTQIGEFPVQRTHFVASGTDISADLYICVQDNSFFCIFVAYSSANKPSIDQTINSLTKLP